MFPSHIGSILTYQGIVKTQFIENLSLLELFILLEYEIHFHSSSLFFYEI